MTIVASGTTAGPLAAVNHLIARAAPRVPRFDPVPCFSSVSASADRCGYLVVPQDRRAPAGPTVRLAIAIYKGTGAHRPADPLVYLQGGPGAGSIGIDFIRQALQAIVPDRDIVLLDQRGVGLSRPALTCPEVSRLQYTQPDLTFAGPVINGGLGIDSPTRLAHAVAATRLCRARLLRHGISLDAFTLPESAADIDALRQALGYRQIDLLAGSYGTRLALTMMRLFPQHLRAVVLDGVDPPQLTDTLSIGATTQRALSTLFASCAADTSCHRAYPRLAAMFYGLVQRLNAHPLRVSVVPDTGDTNGAPLPVRVTGDTLLTLVVTLLASQPSRVPQLVDQIQHGQDDQIVSLYASLFDDSLALGMTNSVECSEDEDVISQSQIDAAAHALRPALRHAYLSGARASMDLCAAWHVPAIPATLRRPVQSGIPTLLLSGQYDPLTPETQAHLVARLLSHSMSFTFPGVGHGAFVQSLCAQSVASAFLDHPAQRPRAACIGQMRSLSSP